MYKYIYETFVVEELLAIKKVLKETRSARDYDLVIKLLHPPVVYMWAAMMQRNVYQTNIPLSGLILNTAPCFLWCRMTPLLFRIVKLYLPPSTCC